MQALGNLTPVVFVIPSRSSKLADDIRFCAKSKPNPWCLHDLRAWIEQQRKVSTLHWRDHSLFSKAAPSSSMQVDCLHAPSLHSSPNLDQPSCTPDIGHQHHEAPVRRAYTVIGHSANNTRTRFNDEYRDHTYFVRHNSSTGILGDLFSCMRTFSDDANGCAKLNLDFVDCIVRAWLAQLT